MNFFFLSLCCMLIGFTLGHPTSPNDPQTDEGREKCFIEVANFLSKVTLDESVQKLVDRSQELHLTFEELAAIKYIPLKHKYDRALEDIGYPEGCDGILKDFWQMAETVDCFTKGSIRTQEDYGKIQDKLPTPDVFEAGLVCSYALKWKTGAEDASIQPFDFTVSNQDKKDCISRTAAFLEKLPLDGSLEQVVKLTRESNITILDFGLITVRPLDREYSNALVDIFDRESCVDFLYQEADIVESVECFETQIFDDIIAHVEVSKIEGAGDRVLAKGACYHVLESRELCLIDAENSLSPLDESVDKFDTESRELVPTYKDFIAAKYVPLKDEFDRALRELEYPEGCDEISKHFQQCFTKEPILSVERYLKFASTVDALEGFWTALVCNYASKWKTGGRDESIEPFDFSNSKEEIKDCIRQTAALYSQVPLDDSLKQVVKLTRDFKITVVDFNVPQERPLNNEYVSAVNNILSQEACDNLNNQLHNIDQSLECYEEYIGSDIVPWSELSTMDGAEDVVLAYEACYQKYWN